MKKFFTIFTVLILLGFSNSSYAQFGDSPVDLAKTSWDFGFGWSYPRYVSVNVISWDGPTNNYGFFISLQRKFSEHVGIRFKGSYSRITGRYDYAARRNQEVATNAIYGIADMLYYFVPCEPLSPYLHVGFGGIMYTIDNPPQAFHADTTYLDHTLNLGFGLEWKLGEDWRLTSEISYHVVPARNFDGDVGTNTGLPGGGTFGGGGLLGGEYDTWMTADLGVKYYFSKGEKSKYCDIYNGIVADVPEVDYDRIEQIVKKYIPKEVVKEVVVEKLVPGECDFMLVGVNFDFNKHTLRPESYPILMHAVKVMNDNPDVKVEIGGHTDNIGSDSYNQKLSENRAKTVKNYLVSKGISESRMTTVGYGEKVSIADNATAEGRAMNRRIEFKIQK